jgi:iron complex outermembrane receptor protein
LNWKKQIGLILLYVAIPSLAIGEEKPTVLLEDVVVTATRTEKDAASAPASVTVITQEDIQKRGARSLDDAISGVAGGYSNRNITGGMMDSLAGGAMTLRGIPRANKTLFMVDGVIINDSYSGSQRSALGISPQQVDRVEIVKGPFSSLYGGYAVGGVVNVMTRMPEERELTLKTGYGSSWDRGEAPDDVKTVYVSGGDKIGDKASVLLSYGYKGTNGYPTDLNVQSSLPTAGITGWSETTDYKGDTRYLIGDRGDKTWWDDNFTVKASYDFTETTKLNLSFTNFRFEYDFDDPHTHLKDASGNPVYDYGSVSEGSYLGLGGRSAHEDRRYAANIETELGRFDIKATFGYIDRPKYYYMTPSSSSATLSGGPGKISSTVAANYNADLAVTFPLGERQIITLGGAYAYGEAEKIDHNLTNWNDEDSKTDMTFYADGKDRTWSVFVQEEIGIVDSLTAYLGFRQDWWETYDGCANYAGEAGYPTTYPSRSADAFSPKAALVYQPFATTTLRSSIGKSFRPPSIYELYSVWIYRGQTTMSGPDLEPEHTTSWDAGIEQRLWPGAKFTATYFENYMKDLIYNQTQSETLVERVNVGEAESKGVELEIEQRFEDLRLFANFTYTDSEVTENDADPTLVGKELVQVPQKMFNIGGDYVYGPFSASLIGRYVSKRYRYDDNRDTAEGVYTSYDPYFVTDARFAYKITSFAELSLSVDNMFDEDYYSYYKAPGRSWFAELSFSY